VARAARSGRRAFGFVQLRLVDLRFAHVHVGDLLKRGRLMGGPQLPQARVEFIVVLYVVFDATPRRWRRWSRTFLALFAAAWHAAALTRRPLLAFGVEVGPLIAGRAFSRSLVGLRL
jgi:hypothetical protein